VGYDLVPDNYQLLKEGRIDVIISQRSQEQGRQAMFSLFRHIILGWKIETRIEMPLDVYFKENVPEAYFSRSYRVSE
jgi:LacI family transcriptional regulator